MVRITLIFLSYFFLPLVSYVFLLIFQAALKIMMVDVVQELRRANAPKNRAKSETRGYSSKPNLPSFSVCNKVLMSLETLLRFKFQNAA